MSNFIPIAEYAKKIGKSRQHIYRLIRDNKFKEEDVRQEEMCKSVLRINEDAKKI